MGKIRGKPKKRKLAARTRKRPPAKPKPKPKKRKAKRNVVRKTQRKRSNPAPKIRKTKNRPAPKRKSKTVKRKTTATVERLTGNSTRVRVDSRYAGKNVTIVRKTTKISGGTKVARGKRGPKLLAQTFEGSAINHFHNIGPSHKNYYYVRIQYSFTVKGKKVISHFSTGIAKIRNENQFREYLADILESFTDSLVGYAKGGFQNIRVSGIIVQGYEK